MSLEPEKQPVEALTPEAPEAAKKKFSLFRKKEKKLCCCCNFEAGISFV